MTHFKTSRFSYLLVGLSLSLVVGCAGDDMELIDGFAKQAEQQKAQDDIIHAALEEARTPPVSNTEDAAMTEDALIESLLGGTVPPAAPVTEEGQKVDAGQKTDGPPSNTDKATGGNSMADTIEKYWKDNPDEALQQKILVNAGKAAMANNFEVFNENWSKLSEEFRLSVTQDTGYGGVTFLQVASNVPLSSRKEGQVDDPRIVEALCPTSKVDALNENNESALLLALNTDNQNLETARALLACGAGVNAQSKNSGYAPIHFIAYYGYADLFELAVERGADLSLLKEGISVLQFADTGLRDFAGDPRDHEQIIQYIKENTQASPAPSTEASDKEEPKAAAEQKSSETAQTSKPAAASQTFVQAAGYKMAYSKRIFTKEEIAANGPEIQAARETIVFPEDQVLEKVNELTAKVIEECRAAGFTSCVPDPEGAKLQLTHYTEPTEGGVQLYRHMKMEVTVTGTKKN